MTHGQHGARKADEDRQVRKAYPSEIVAHASSLAETAMRKEEGIVIPLLGYVEV